MSDIINAANRGVIITTANIFTSAGLHPSDQRRASLDIRTKGFNPFCHLSIHYSSSLSVCKVAALISTHLTLTYEEKGQRTFAFIAQPADRSTFSTDAIQWHLVHSLRSVSSVVLSHTHKHTGSQQITDAKPRSAKALKSFLIRFFRFSRASVAYSPHPMTSDHRWTVMME